MAAKLTDSAITSDVADVCDLPLDDEFPIDDVEYEYVTRRILASEGAGATAVSAFNSSI